MTIMDLFRLPLGQLLLNMSGRHLGAKLYQRRHGVCHGDDLFYLFPFSQPGFPRPLKSDADRAVSRKMCALWTGFAVTGDPLGKECAYYVFWL